MKTAEKYIKVFTDSNDGKPTGYSTGRDEASLNVVRRQVEYCTRDAASFVALSRGLHDAINSLSDFGFKAVSLNIEQDKKGRLRYHVEFLYNEET